ncbi:TetR family transcriptional regulator [Afipia sp. P52-10]|nr:TetR family transcriptional regulator [Afipia sp. P52-10]
MAIQSNPPGPAGAAAVRNRARSSKREAGVAERRQAIIDAALVEFSAKGFAASRLEDIAKRAKVGKGTIYLHFFDKEALFQELVRTSIVPLLGRLTPPATGQMSARAIFEMFATTFEREVLHTQRGDIVRLIIAEGARFPSLSEFYHREVISRGMAGMRTLVEYGIARGEITHPALVQFPQLLIAPAMVAVIWEGLFGKYDALDVKAMLKAHIDLIFGPGRPA